MRLNTEGTYKALQPFHTIEELNANTSEIRVQFGDSMTQSTRNVLDVLARYSSKFYGVSYRSKTKIAEELGISRRTVIRACNALEALGVIKQHTLFRHNGDKRQSSNAIVFVKLTPVEADVTPECHSEETPLNAHKPSSLLHNTYATQQSPTLYQRFKSLLSNTTGDTSSASRLFGVYKAQSIKLLRFDIHADQGDLLADLAIQALNITSQATRHRKIRSLTGYFDGVLRSLIDKSLFIDAYKDYSLAIY